MQSYVNSHMFDFWLGLAIIVVAVFFWVLRLSTQQRRLHSRMDSMLSEVEGGNVEGLLLQYMETVKHLSGQVRNLQSRLDELSSDVPSMVRHVGLVRFSPFHDTGGNQSFSLAILDSRGDGVVISGLHSRLESKLFAKPVTGAKSEFSLTREEVQAIESSMRGAQGP